MHLHLLLVVFGAVCGSTFDTRQRRAVVTDEEVEKLKEEYSLTESPFGKYLFGNVFTNPTNNAELLVLQEGACAPFTKFPIDRLYLIHKGRALFDIYDLNSQTVETKCLGDPLKKEKCDYSVAVPAGAIITIRPKGDVILTGVIFGGTVKDGKRIATDTMKTDFPDDHKTINKLNECLR